MKGGIVFLNATVNRVSTRQGGRRGHKGFGPSGRFEITDGKDKIWVNCHGHKTLSLQKRSGKTNPAGDSFLLRRSSKGRILIGSLSFILQHRGKGFFKRMAS